MHSPMPLSMDCTYIFYIYSCIRASSSGQVSCSLNMLCASGTLVYSWLPFPILLAFSYHREMEVPACLLTVRCSNFLQLMVTHGRLCWIQQIGITPWIFYSCFASAYAATGCWDMIFNFGNAQKGVVMVCLVMVNLNKQNLSWKKLK